MKKFLRSLRKTKGVNGVIVALLLILVGVGAVAGISTFMNNSKDTITNSVGTSLTNMTAANEVNSSN